MKNYPLIKFVVVFILGILFQHFIQLDFIVSFTTFLISLIVYTFIIFFRKKGRSSWSIIISYFAIFLFGASYYAFSFDQRVQYPFDQPKLKKSDVFGTISRIELLRNDFIAFEADIDSIRNNGVTKSVKIKLLCKIWEEEPVLLKNTFKKLSVGNKFSLYGTVYKGRETRNPGEFDYQHFLESKDISGVATAYKLRDLKVSDSSIHYIANAIFIVRKSIDNTIKKFHNKNSASLLRGLLLADRSEIDYELKEKFVNAGVVHVLAVSGLHVGYIVLIFLVLTSRLNLHLRLGVTIAGLLFFLVLTEHPPSVFRATLMAIVMIVSFLSGRSYNNINSLAFAALILLLINPTDLFNPGFQLSFSAVLSIVLLHPIFKQWILALGIKNKFSRGILIFAGVSLAAQLGTLPFTIMYFKKLSIAALFANLIVIPLIGIILAVGIFTLFLTIMLPRLALIYAAANDLFADLLFELVEFVGSLKYSFIHVNNFSRYDAIIFFVLLISFFFFIKRFTGTIAKFIFSLMILTNFFLLCSLDNKKLLEDGKLSIMMVDVGQGDGILVKFPDETVALIDAGNANQYYDAGKRTFIPLLKTLEIDKIDIGFISHMDADHYKGFESLVKEGLISSIYKPKIDTTLKRDVLFEELLVTNKVPINYYSKTFLDFGNSRLYILTDTNDVVYNSFDVNNKSGVFKLVHGKNKILFVGDAEKEAEKNLVNRYKSFLKSDVLKAGHHGSKTSSTSELLYYVDPQYALISAGVLNKFNHPSISVIERLQSKTINIYRTDIQGAILLQSDGENLSFIDWRTE